MNLLNNAKKKTCLFLILRILLFIIYLALRMLVTCKTDEK